MRRASLVEGMQIRGGNGRMGMTRGPRRSGRLRPLLAGRASRWRIFLGTALAVAAAIWGVAASWAQIRVQIGPNGAVTRSIQGQGSSVILPTDRTLSRGVRRAQQGIEEGRFTESLALLDEVLGRDEDLFIPVGEDGKSVGLKSLAASILDELPQEGRSIYEAAYGPIAQRELAAAVDAADEDRIAKIAQRYLNTPAGRQAALLAAVHHADVGRHSTAALIYGRLLESPAAQRQFGPALSLRAAASWLAAGRQHEAVEMIRQAAGAQRLRIGSREESLSSIRSDQQALEWLQRHLKPGRPAEEGGLGESPSMLVADDGRGGLPHMWVRWKARMLYPALEPIYRELAADLLQSGQLRPPAAEPVVSGDHVLIRSASDLLAVHMMTGKLMWRISAAPSPQLDELIRSASGQSKAELEPEPMQAFARRIWEDRLWGTVSADDKYAYAVGALSMPSSDLMLQAPMGVGFGDNADAAMGDTNTLSAYDVADRGKLVWEIDGAATDGELSGAFFLGAPLAVENQLYCTVEIKGEGEGAVYLAALDRLTRPTPVAPADRESRAWHPFRSGTPHAVRDASLWRRRPCLSHWGRGSRCRQRK